MRFNNPLNQIFNKKSKIKILRLLSLFKKESSVREISREVGVAPPNVSNALRELEKEGVLFSKKVGRSIIYSLDLNHYLVKNVILPAFNKEKETKKILVNILKAKLNFPVELIILFGSMARRKEKPDSDIDLLFIISDKSQPRKLEERVSVVNNQIIGYFGNSISPLILRTSEFKSRFEKNDKLIKSISKEGEVLEGKLISEVLCQK
ncbi:nucleotidyltransferase domain-containing protein [Patescibacteria group bacterium]|nr:nucleotidyltransferase domain-containing protein [Patescibacteria group bacterium]